MSEPTWEQLFEAVGQVPGSTKQQPSKETFEELARKTEFARKRYASDVAVAMGAVDTGDDFDPLTAINDQYNAGGQSTADLKRETTQIAAGLAQLQADVTANNNSGKSFVVSVSDYGTTVPTVFDLVDNSGAGGIYNDGNTLQMSNDDGREILGYNVEPLLTNHFEVSLVVPKQAGTTLGSYVDRALFFIGRGDSTFDNYCVARLNGNKLRVGAVIDGVSTLDSPTWFPSGALGTGPNEVTVTPGVYMTFQGGTIGDDRVFMFKVNNQIRAIFNDTADASLIGDDYRWTGCGIRNDDDATNKSPSISHFMANDNFPAAISGTGAKMVRTSTAGVSVSSGVNELPSNFFDLAAEVSETITMDLVNGTFTVHESDWYTVTFRSRISSSFPNHLELGIYVNGLPGPFGGSDHMFGSNALGGTIIPNAVGASIPVYLNADDEVGIGYESDGFATPVFRGEATGHRTYAAIVRGK